MMIFMTVQKVRMEVAVRRKDVCQVTKKLITAGLAAALDRGVNSSRQATAVLAEAAKRLRMTVQTLLSSRPKSVYP